MGNLSWEQLWPSHCKSCHAYGEYQLYNSDADADCIYETCPDCIGKRKCPRCGLPNSVSRIESSCPCCGWQRGDGGPEGMLTTH
jgi:hypothetical protein